MHHFLSLDNQGHLVRGRSIRLTRGGNQVANSAEPPPSLVLQDCADQIVNYYWGFEIFN